MAGPAPDRVARRRLLAAVGAGSVVGLAGCIGGDDGDDSTSDGDPSPHLVDHPGDEPKEFEGHHSCGVCTMGVTDYSDRNAQLAHENGQGMLFCSPGCLFAYTVDPHHFDGLDSEIVGVWVTDFDTREVVDGFDAFFVLDDDEERVSAPMGIDPPVYADEETALEYVDEYDDLSDEDVITYDEVDREVARIYRDTFV